MSVLSFLAPLSRLDAPTLLGLLSLVAAALLSVISLIRRAPHPGKPS
ncbi:MAG: hypothetical protein LBO77_00825 [Desulfovibrio sp.]|jgi:hypothetical protein|nr:hypothetical protein [Desulfovibrio sp.]